MSQSIVYIVTHDLNGIVYTAGFTTLLQAKRCKAHWVKQWGGNGRITIHEQWIYDEFEEVE